MNVMSAAAEALSLQLYIDPMLVIKAAAQSQQSNVLNLHFCFFVFPLTTFPNAGIVTAEVGCFVLEGCLSPCTASRFGSLSLSFSSQSADVHKHRLSVILKASG